MNENGDNILCKKCNNRVKFSIAKLLSTFPEVLILTLDRCSFDKDKLENVIDDSPIQINETLNLSFNSLREINGSSVVYKPVAAVGRIGSESAQYGHFISYIIEPGVVTKIDDTKIKKVPTSILNTDNFQRQLFIAVYQKQKLLFPNGEKENLWSVSDEVLAKIDAIFQVKQDKDLGKLYLSSFKSLQNNEWLHSEVVDLAFRYLAEILEKTSSYSFNLFKKFAQGKVTYDDIFKNVSKDTDCLVIPIHQRFHWISAAIFVESKIITVFDYFYKRKKVKVFSQLLKIAKTFTTDKKMLFKKED